MRLRSSNRGSARDGRNLVPGTCGSPARPGPGHPVYDHMLTYPRQRPDTSATRHPRRPTDQDPTRDADTHDHPAHHPAPRYSDTPGEHDPATHEAARRSARRPCRARTLPDPTGPSTARHQRRQGSARRSRHSDKGTMTTISRSPLQPSNDLRHYAHTTPGSRAPLRPHGRRTPLYTLPGPTQAMDHVYKAAMYSSTINLRFPPLRLRVYRLRPCPDSASSYYRYFDPTFRLP